MRISAQLFLQTLGLSVILSLGHWALTTFTALTLPQDFLFRSHIFLTLITLVTLLSLVYVWKHFYDKVGFAFLAFILIKMALSITFLIPLIKSGGEIRGAVLHFFAAYFLYLIWDVWQVVKLLAKRPS